MKLIRKSYSCEHPTKRLGMSVATGDCLVVSCGMTGRRGFAFGFYWG